MLKVKNLTKIYGKGDSAFKALDNVSFELEEGANLAILGKSGSGKSTLMHCVAALDSPSDGKVFIGDTDVWALTGKALDKFRNESIGFIFQSFYLQSENTVLENVMVPLEIRGESSRTDAAMDALKKLELDDKAQNRADTLSGGQKQRAVIARAIVGEPKIVFADEPTGNLDSKTGAKVEQMLFDLNKESNISLITVTHDEELASRFDNVIELSDGKIISHKGKGLKV